MRAQQRKTVKTERLVKIAISAMNQSLKSTLPEITELTDYKSLVTDGFEGENISATAMTASPCFVLPTNTKEGM